MRKASSSMLRVAGASLIALGFASTPALAQDAAAGAEDTTGLGDIVVTARKVAENLQNVPIAITAFSGQEIQERNIQQFADVATFTPGFSARANAGTTNASTLTIRGLVQEDTLATLDPSVGTYIDGINWARAYGMNSGLLDVNSVQVLKGPQGTLFGRNTTGGALVVTTNDPRLDALSGRLSLTYGRFNEREASGFVNVPLGSKVAVRLAGQISKRDGYSTNTVGATTGTAFTSVLGDFLQRPLVVGSPNGYKFDSRDRTNLRGKLLLQPTDTLKLVFSAEYFDSDDTAPSRQFIGAYPTYTAGTGSAANVSSTASLFAGILSGGPAPTGPNAAANAATSTALGLSVLNAIGANHAANPNLITENEVPYSKARTYTYNFIGSLDTDWGQIKLLTGYRRVKAATLNDLDGTAFQIHQSGFKQNLRQMSGELQITGKAFNNSVDFAAGVFVFNEEGFDESASITLPQLNANTGQFYGLINNDSAGIYGQATWHLSDQFSFTGGLRWSVDDKGLDTRAANYSRTTGLTSCLLVPGSFNLGPTMVFDPIQCRVARRDSFQGWSYTAGIEWKPTEDLLLYAKTSKGFRSGGQNLRAAIPAALIPFRPETAFSHEAGLKFEGFDRRLRVNLSGYLTIVKDIQRSTTVGFIIPPATTPQITTVLGNAGKARFIGGELEVQAVVFEGFKVSASAALVEPKYLSFSDPVTGNRAGERFRYVVKEQFTLAADYNTQLSSDIGLRLHVDYAWRGKFASEGYNYPGNPSNAAIVAATTIPSLGLLGARATVTIGDNYELAVFGRNLTNERSYVNNLLIAGLGYVAGQRMEPTTYGVTAAFSF